MKRLWNIGIEEENTEEEDPIILVESDEPEIVLPFRHGIFTNLACVELLAGNLMYLLIGSIIIMIFIFDIKYLLGFITGVCMSCGMVVHMAVFIEQALRMGEFGAEKHIKKGTAIRYGVLIVLFSIIGITKVVDIIAAMVGVMALKVSAYSQPLTHKVLLKIFKKGR